MAIVVTSACLAAGQEPHGNDLAGRVIAEIRFRGADAASQDPLTEYLAVKQGEPLAMEKVSASIKSLFATGKFSNIEAEVDETPDGRVILTFALEQR